MYEKIYKNILNPFYENIIKRRHILSHRAFLEKSQWWSREKLLDYQWQELKKLLKQAYQEVPYWQDVFKRLNMTADDIRTYADFQKLPIIDKEDIRKNKARMISNNWQGKTWTKSTGGSTGVPLELDYTPDSYDWRVAVSKRGYGWAGCEDGKLSAYIWSVNIGKTSRIKSLKEKLFFASLRQKRFNIFQWGETEMDQCLNFINRSKPRVIVSYATGVYQFAKYIKEHKKICATVPSIITGAEKIHPFERELIESVFHGKVFNTYGCREFMLIAAECEKHSGLHLSLENLFIEILDESGQPVPPGTVGAVVVTDLHNYGMPFIRYRAGDLARLSPHLCSCGRGLPLLEDVEGRILDLIQTPDGRKITGVYFPHLLKEFTGIKRFQILQKDLNVLIVKIIKDTNFDHSQLSSMREEIVKVVGNSVQVVFEFVDNIPLTQTGKFRVTISNIK